MAEEMMELGFPLDVVEAMEKEGRWPDLSRLSKRRPEVIPLCCWLLAARVPVREICVRLTLSASTVQEIGKQHANVVVTEKDRIAANRNLALLLASEHNVELAAKGKLDVFSQNLLWQQKQVEEGGVTDRKEIRVTSEEAEALEFFQALEKKAGGMVLEAEVLPHMGAPVAAAATRSQQMVIDADQGPESPPITTAKPL